MAINSNHALGRQAAFFAKIESTPGTLDSPWAAANAIKCLPGSTGFDFQQVRDDVDESRATRSTEERTTNKRTVTWNYAGYVRPSGTAGTAPDVSAILEAALGTTANTPGTRQRYTLSDAQAVKLLSMGLEQSGVVSELIWGAYVNQLTISGSGGDRPQIQANGGAFGHAYAGTGTVNGSAAGGTTLTITAGDEDSFDVDSYVEFSDGQDNGGAGFRVTAITASTMTVTPAHAGFSGGETILPLQVTPTTVGSPLPGIAGGITVGGTSRPLRGYSITVDNQIGEVSDEVGEEGSTDVIPGFRLVSGSLDFRSRADMTALFGARKGFSTQAVVLTLGDTAGDKVVITLPAVEMEFSAFQRSADDSLLFTLPFRGLASTAPDEIQIDFE